MNELLIFLLVTLILFNSSCVNWETNDNKNAAIPTQQLTEQPTQEPTNQPTQEPTEQPTTELTEQPKEDQLTYDEILRLRKVVCSVDKLYADNLKDAYELFQPNAVIAVVDVLSEKFYYGWEGCEGFDGWITVEARVVELKDEFNAAGVKPGDILQLGQCAWLQLENIEDAYAFFAEKYDTVIDNAEDFKALKENQNGFFQVIPQKGIEYSIVVLEDDYLVKPGERYALLCEIDNRTTVFGRPNSYFSYAYPMNGRNDLEEFAEKSGYYLWDEYITISKQLAALFRHTEHIGESMIK